MKKRNINFTRSTRKRDRKIEKKEDENEKEEEEEEEEILQLFHTIHHHLKHTHPQHSHLHKRHRYKATPPKPTVNTLEAVRRMHHGDPESLQRGLDQHKGI
ncbi:hypothetical protein E2C01_044549 [Portunus trituberculatus]|uniref:Uncharacterized protein n=1 Tax=Portunus trituberculatus TaxID=210409 RepID=A0A5B7FZM9_PORTR|nr:hypothetical protein [Portunus trituberculatus]